MLQYNTFYGKYCSVLTQYYNIINLLIGITFLSKKTYFLIFFNAILCHHNLLIMIFQKWNINHAYCVCTESMHLEHFVEKNFKDIIIFCSPWVDFSPLHISSLLRLVWMEKRFATLKKNNNFIYKRDSLQDVPEWIRNTYVLHFSTPT